MREDRLELVLAQNIYDDPQFFEGYSQFRRSQEGLPGAPEWPVLRSMLPPMEGLRVLDLGCGFGAFARWAAEAGAQSVLGLDLSERMLETARSRTQDTRITYQRANIEELALAESSFDLVYSSLVLHYLEDFKSACITLRRLLAPGGSLVFSVEHPIYTAPSHPGWQTDENGSQVWPLDSYLHEGKRVTDWITPGVVKYHRTVAGYVNPLLEEGFRLVRLVEWGPDEEQIATQPELAIETHRPSFLLIAAQK
jgi:SAM-dependent methyltransferase